MRLRPGASPSDGFRRAGVPSAARWLLLIAFACAVWLVAARATDGQPLKQAKGNAIAPGFDLFETDPAATTFSFTGGAEIPPGFFGTGSLWPSLRSFRTSSVMRPNTASASSPVMERSHRGA